MRVVFILIFLAAFSFAQDAEDDFAEFDFDDDELVKNEQGDFED